MTITYIYFYYIITPSLLIYDDDVLTLPLKYRIIIVYSKPNI